MAGRKRSSRKNPVEPQAPATDWFEFAPISLLMMSGAGIIRQANQRAAAMLGGEPHALVGLPLAGFCADRRLFRGQLAASRQSDPAATQSIDLLLLPRGRPSIEVQMTLRRARSGPGYQVVLLDVTERLRLLAAEQEARTASEARETFIAMLSHELRTPLTPVLAAAAALRDGNLTVRQIQESCAIIERNVALQARLIDDLLDISRVVRGKMPLDLRPVALHPLIKEVVQMVAEEVRAKKQSLVVDLGAAQQTVSGDPVRLRQVFWNLLRNAVKFTPNDGRVTIESWNNGGLITVEIRDTGPGLGNDQIEELFQPFQQGANGHGGGLGLGLAIARGIVELHQGKIAASNRGPGSGACFVVHLPTVTGLSFPTLGDPGRPRLAPRLNEGIRILLVEDHRDTAEAFRRLLGAHGFDVQIACTMRDALKVDLARVSLVISDVGLPDGDGPTLLRRLRRKRKVKAIALSGYGAEADIRKSLAAGFGAHLVKPITIASLVAAIHKALDG